MGYQVPAGITNKHLHISKEDFATLFGADAEMTILKAVSQPGQYASEQRVDVVGPNNTLKNVRILGPFRPQTQVELAVTDCIISGIPAVLRESGNLAGTPGCKLVGPAGEVEIKEGVIVSRRHIHLSAAQAEEAGVKDKEVVSVRFEGPRGVIFENVLVRSGEGHERDMHLDTDEANCAQLANAQLGEIVK